MALVACRECGQKISSGVRRCPACGYRRPLPWVVIIVGTIVVTVVLAHVSKQNTPVAVPTPRPATPTPVHINGYAGLSVADQIKRASALDQRWAQSNTPKSHILIENAEIADARAALLAIPESDASKRRAKALLDHFDKNAADGKLGSEIVERKGFAANAEVTMLSKGMSVTVTAEGPTAKTLRVQYVLVTKALAYQIGMQTDFVNNAYKAGFEKVILDDGYGKRWVYNKE